MSGDRKLERETLGAWLLSCSPNVFDLTSTADQRAAVISWSLAHTYRNELVAPGDPVLLWVGGQEQRGHTPGVWAHGLIAGDLFEDTGDGDWVNEERKAEVRPYVPLLLTWLEPPLAKKRLQEHSLLKGIEILRMPRMANPSYLTPDETDAFFDTVYDEYSAPVQSRLP